MTYNYNPNTKEADTGVSVWGQPELKLLSDFQIILS